MKSVALAGADVFVDMHSPEDLDSDAFWKHFHRKSGGKHVLEFGGSHRKSQGVEHAQSHEQQVLITLFIYYWLCLRGLH
ncbi:MAG: hypothetical protein CME32_25855 [Gimesia sp.]|nr:hypothetical protein [Gimesia sp.]